MSIKVVELFAGVGGFRIGLEGYPRRKNSPYTVVWSNQWEPSTKKQHASLVYQERWPQCDHANQNIEEILEQNFELIPDHDLLVGGFPCQDYSVATSLKNSKGLRGKKGVLWWSIESILRRKGKNAPDYLMLENVDRLLISPADQRGRDFAIMLSSLAQLDYAVEWKVINAGDYGMPQRRRRVFIMAYKKGTSLYKEFKKSNKQQWILADGVMARAFPSSLYNKGESTGQLQTDLETISKEFNSERGKSPFANSGAMIDGQYWSMRTKAEHAGPRITLGEVLLPIREVDSSFHIQKTELNGNKGWVYQKGAKKIERTNVSGHRYTFSEGSLTFPDALDRPSRTIITGEGGRSPSRFKHVVEQEGVFRRLCPVELERLNMFPDNHTKVDGISDTKRAFFMGNALVVGVVERLGKELASRIL